MGIVKQPDLSGVSDEVRKYIGSLTDAHDEMVEQLEKATEVIEELTDSPAASDEGDDDDGDDDDTEETTPPPTSKKKKVTVTEEEETPVATDDKDTKVGKSLDDIMKSHPELASRIAKAEQRAEAAEKIAKAERDRRLEQEFIAKAKTLDSLAIEHEPVAKVLQTMADKLTPAENEVIWKALHAANEQASAGALFNELGSSARGGKTGVAETDLNKAAKALQEADPKLSYADAVTKAVAVDPTLYHEYVEEQRQARR